MIRKIKFSNFYSFKGEQEISFLTTKKNGYSYFQSKNKKTEQITKVAGFIGSNASGKTNVMRVFGFLSYFVTETIKKNLNSLDTSLKTFFNNEEESLLEVEFEIDKYIYTYGISIKKHIVNNERLQYKKIGSKGSPTKVFDRGIDKTKLNKKIFINISKKNINSIRKDVSLIAFIKANYGNIKVINDIFNYFQLILVNINEYGQISNNEKNVRKLYLENLELKDKMENFINNFDTGPKKIFNISEQKTSDGIAKLKVEVINKIGVKEYPLNFTYESRGTQQLFNILIKIFLALETNSLLVLDEIETALHPEAVNKLITYFIDENENGKAQLIFSSHVHNFLNKFDREQIYLCSKDINGESKVVRLDKISSKVRSDENFLVKYSSGAYGAYPKITV